MMENKDISKYYCPTIDEFYIGFEYERLINESGHDSYWNFDLLKDKWESRIFTKSDFEKGRGWDNRRDIEDKWIRVKYLDKEDIESLGFKYNKTQPGLNEDYFEYESAEYYMDYEYDTNYCRIYFSLEPGDATVFAGCIQNKSELKKLLTQLGI